MKKQSKKNTRLSRNFFDTPDHPAFHLVNELLTVTIIASITAAVLETVESLAPYQLWFTVTEYIAVTLFSIEYIARITLSKKPLRYIFSFYGLIDLLAIIPTLLGLADFTFLKLIRIIRTLRLLRMTHVVTFADTTHQKARAGSLFLFHLEMWLLAAIGAVLTLGTSLYIFEEVRAPNIPAGMLWALKIIGGLSHTIPESTPGTFIIMATKVTGAGLLALLLLMTGTMMWKSVRNAK